MTELLLDLGAIEAEAFVHHVDVKEEHDRDPQDHIHSDQRERATPEAAAREVDAHAV
eukprot:CAMPEP_0115878870 /NCGR_PEP_ID=MMETSP0287-20121206/27010_1 /TAXON_ID=412157 /ORGANISM="Chrysochromulina rotalis, Strain UIO044" /LENGTH=56 /DNA_ID=CAMNT_0003334527 /DNA_START=64 /DNA_END=230 /DNA_ORIENTATION=-